MKFLRLGIGGPWHQITTPLILLFRINKNDQEIVAQHRAIKKRCPKQYAVNKFSVGRSGPRFSSRVCLAAAHGVPHGPHGSHGTPWDPLGPMGATWGPMGIAFFVLCIHTARFCKQITNQGISLQKIVFTTRPGK